MTGYCGGVRVRRARGCVDSGGTSTEGSSSGGSIGGGASSGGVNSAGANSGGANSGGASTEGGKKNEIMHQLCVCALPQSGDV